jgi:excisionase family DNA binding protein
LRIVECAQLTGLSASHLYALAERGELPTKRVGGRIVVRAQAFIADWFDS